MENKKVFMPNPEDIVMVRLRDGSVVPMKCKDAEVLFLNS